MNILVTGGKGYIGSRFIERYHSDHKIWVMDIREWGDITSPKDVEEVMRGIDAVIHLAAIVGEDACKQDTRKALEVNVVGTHIVVEEAKRAGVKRFVFASTGNVYGRTLKPVTETHNVMPQCFYGDTKMLAESVVKDAGYTVVRFGTVCGYSPNMRWDLLPHALIKAAREGERFELYGPDAFRPLTHIDDAVGALMALISRDPNASLKGKVFNVVSENMTKGRLAYLVETVTSNFGFVTNVHDKKDKRDYQMNGELIDRTVGWRPKWTVREAITQVVERCQKNNVL